MPTPPNAPHEWTTTGLLDEVVENNKNMQDRSLAFILGAGASVTSGIPAGGKLAQRWLKEIYDRENMHPDTTLETWAAGKLGAPDFQLADAATQYAKIFSLRFGRDPQSGYAALQAAMEEAEPSIGYAILARLLATTRHKVVVTTNFDNLVADALAIHALQSPLVVGHEALAGFVRPRLSRPLVAKIHRDLHLDPINDQNGVNTLPNGWRDALESLFKHYTPMVIGYGGNDGSLMGFLEKLEPGFIPGGILWCYREGNRPSQKVQDVVARHSGVLVAIAGFDEFMVQLIEKLEPGFKLENIATEIEYIGRNRAKKYREEMEKFGASTANNTERDTPASNKVWQSVLDVTKGKTSWWTWELLARGESDLDKKKELYEEGLAAFPNSADLAGCYAIFLTEQHDYDAADAMYRKAIELDPSNARNTGNYALFLANERHDYDAADAMYRKAIELDPNNANHTGNYAIFLADQRQDYDAADALFRKAIELDPSNARHTGNYAVFLVDQRQDYDAADAMFRKAIELDPSNANNTGNYASFLANERHDYDAADAMFRKAIELDPNDLNSLANWVCLRIVHTKAQDLPEVQQLIQQVIALSKGQVSQALAEVLLYDVLLAATRLSGASCSQSISRLKGALTRGFVRGSWDFSAVFEATFPRIAAEDHDFYRALGSAILDESKVGLLADYPQWRDAPEGDPFALDAGAGECPANTNTQ